MALGALLVSSGCAQQEQKAIATNHLQLEFTVEEGTEMGYGSKYFCKLNAASQATLHQPDFIMVVIVGQDSILAKLNDGLHERLHSAAFDLMDDPIQDNTLGVTGFIDAQHSGWKLSRLDE
jgi:hypothetical protein